MTRAAVCLAVHVTHAAVCRGGHVPRAAVCHVCWWVSRYGMLQDTVDGYRKEIASLREKAQKMAATAQKNEQSVHSLTQDLRAAQEKLTMAEV